MERLKRSQTEQQTARTEPEEARSGDDGAGCPPSALEVLEQELARAQAVLHQGEPTGIVGPPPSSAPPRAEPLPLPRGTSVGRYLVLERLGAGGMGEVYAAFDPQLNRRVAIKLLLPGGEGQDRGQARLRLMREAQSMARLSHPNVLPVYDLGEHGDQIFIALELVEGQTLRQWLKEQPRTWREVVHVLSLAGRGLAAAHAGGLVHRDFKPDNVLVGRDGRVLVFDFGLACEQGTGSSRAPLPVDLTQVFGSESHPHESGSLSGLSTRDLIETPVTRAGLIMGTPGYMAPEQYRHEPLTGAADQFSFCATLYYGLYAEHAFEGQGAAALARATLEGRLRSAPRDSKVPAALRRTVLQGLRLEPRERYPSMEALLEALHDEPPPQRVRHVLVAVAAAFLVAVVAGAVSQWHQRQGLCEDVSARLEGTWDTARQERLQKAFLATGQPSAAEAWRSVRTTLEAHATQWLERRQAVCEADRLRQDSSQEPSREVLAARTTCLEHRRLELQAFTDLLLQVRAEQVSRAPEAAHGLSELAPCDTQVPPTTHRPGPVGEGPSEVLYTALARARALRLWGQPGTALAATLPVVDSARALGDPALEAEALLELGEQRASLDDPKAEPTLRQAVWTADEAGQDEVRAQALVRLTALVAKDATREADGQEWYQQAHALLTRLGRTGRLLAELESAHGLLSSVQGDFRAAEASQRTALAALQPVVSADGPEAARVLRRLGNALSAQGRHVEALAVYERAQDAFRTSLGAENSSVGSTLVHIGTTLSALGRSSEALVPLRQGLALIERTLPASHPFHARALESLGAVLARTGELDEAIQVLLRAVERAERIRGLEHPDVAGPCTTLGDVLLQAGRPQEALERYSRALRLRERVLGPSHPELAASFTGQGEALVQLGRPAEALVPLERALALRSSAAVAPEDWARTRFALARALWESHTDETRARRLAREARDALGQPGSEALRVRVQAWLDSRS